MEECEQCRCWKLREQGSWERVVKEAKTCKPLGYYMKEIMLLGFLCLVILNGGKISIQFVLTKNTEKIKGSQHELKICWSHYTKTKL